MPDRSPFRLPPVICALIHVASWLVPAGLRQDWRRKRLDNARQWWAFLVERNQATRGEYARLIVHCRSAFTEALWLRFRRAELRNFLRGPGAVLIAGAIFLGITAAASGGFRTLRATWSPLPYPDADRLVTIEQSSMIGLYGVSPRQYREWKRNSKTLSGLAAFRVHAGRGFATPDLFPLLGVRAAIGRTFRPEDRDAALLSHAAWTGRYLSDPAIIGRGILAEGQLLRVIGVLPPDLPGLPDNVRYWMVFDPEAKDAPRIVDAVARLRPGVRRDAARADLMRTLAAARFRIDREIRVSPLRGPTQARALGFGGVVSFGVIVGVVLGAIGKQSPVAGRISRRHALRCWAFLCVKSVLVLGSLTLFWMEMTGALQVRLRSPNEFRAVVELTTIILPAVLFLIAFSLAVVWSIGDQRRRCPVCLHRLAMPVTIGSWSSALLDPVSTEFVCEQGHGALAVPETQSSVAEPDRWTSMDDSWRDLFVNK